jgi:hypothetical protein
MMLWRRATLAVILVAASLAGQDALGQSVDQTVQAYVMLGIDRSNGSLNRYHFANQERTVIGVVRNSGGNALLGIDAAAYFPGLRNIYVLWEDPDDHSNKLVYVDATDARATVVVSDLEGGRFTGAAAFHSPTLPYAVFAVQAEKIKPPATITGIININPNNSDSNEFSCTRGDGTTITRDHLHQDSPIGGDGTYYRGPATRVHVKPKGNGGQNGLVIDGQAYDLRNSNTYDFDGQMEVRVYNDNASGGKAMGQWWIHIISGTVTINNDVQVLTPNRLARVDQDTGVVTEVMPLTRQYRGLTTADGRIFYTATGDNLYRIDTVALTETKVGDMAVSHASDVKLLGAYLLAYDIDNVRLLPVNPATAGAVGAPASLGMGRVGTMMFVPVEKDTILLPKNPYD